MTVEARCADCDDVHPVGDRRRRNGTTACPACGSPAYTSECRDGAVRKPESERIADACRDVHGVGQGNLTSIVGGFGTYVEFEAAGVDELAALEGVGPTIAERIVARR